jgi:sulfite reductase (NADPH) flavoprotein alpha-component
MNFVPILPQSAPFTAEQRAYLNGFLAGLYAWTPVPAANAAPAPPPRHLEPLAILFGSQTGNAARLAKQLAKEAGRQGFAPTVHDLAKFQPAQLAAERHVLVVSSTYGDGDPPDNARAFWESLNRDTAPRLDGLRFSVCALGDRNYPKFCQFGKELDARLEQLGATRVQPRQDCDVEFEEAFAQWCAAALNALAHANGLSSAPPPHAPSAREAVAARGPRSGAAAPDALTPLPPARAPHATADTNPVSFSKKHPFPARLLVNRRLSGAGSAKEVRHLELSLEGSGLAYEVGDALGVFPANDPALVDEVLRALDCDGEEAVPGKDGPPVALRLALRSHFEITRIPQTLLAAVAERSGDAQLRRLISPEANGELAEFLDGRDILDLLRAYPGATFSPAEFTGRLRKLQPRLYSIASSPKAHPGQVHLTVGVVRYQAHGRRRGGVGSTFLADRAGPDTPVPVFVHANPAFRPPAPDVPLIMVGPGTGIAPFRAFLQERQASGARGRNWLFFGDQHCATDFLYREEIEAFRRDGLLTRLDLAWSRDQAEKVYVQHRLLEHADELWRWLEAGAGFFVCGDARSMAKDVDAALHRVIETAGGMSADAAADYVQRLKAERRYCRDVY